MDATHAHKDMVRSGFTLKFFGFLRADVEADSRRMSLDLQFPIYLMSPADPSQMQKQTGDLTMHPRLTRFGFDVVSPNLANGWTYYVANRYHLGNGLTLGLDWIHWRTKFKALPMGTNNRVMFFIQNDF